MGKYDYHHPDIIKPIEFHDMNCCPRCRKPSLIMVDTEQDITSIDSNGLVSDVISCRVESFVACPECGFKTENYVIDGQSRIKICTEAEKIYEIDEARKRTKDRILKIRPDVGLKSLDDNPFVMENVTITKF